MENENQISEIVPELDPFVLEERCEKAIKTLNKAIFMRLFVTAVLVWGVLQTSMDLWIVGLMGLVMIINLAGLLPLVKERKKQKLELKKLIEEE